MAVAIAALLVRPLVAASPQELIDLLLERRLQHLAGSLADEGLEHIVRGGDWRSGRQNLIRLGHGVTLLNLPEPTPGRVLNTGRLRRFSAHSSGPSLSDSFHRFLR
jgi:hypothetical protein